MHLNICSAYCRDTNASYHESSCGAFTVWNADGFPSVRLLNALMLLADTLACSNTELEATAALAQRFYCRNSQLVNDIRYLQIRYSISPSAERVSCLQLPGMSSPSL